MARQRRLTCTSPSQKGDVGTDVSGVDAWWRRVRGCGRGADVVVIKGVLVAMSEAKWFREPPGGCGCRRGALVVVPGSAADLMLQENWWRLSVRFADACLEASTLKHDNLVPKQQNKT